MNLLVRRRRRAFVLTALALAIGALATGLLLGRGDGGAALAEVAPAEHRLEAPELEGDVLVPPPVRLVELRGEPVVVNFWASWCVPCRKEAPELARFARESPERARLVGVNFQDAKGDALAFVKEFSWRFPNVGDPNGALAARYGLLGLPTTYVIDREGRIARQLTGEQTFETIRQAVEEAG